LWAAFTSSSRIIDNWLFCSDEDCFFFSKRGSPAFYPSFEACISNCWKLFIGWWKKLRWLWLLVAASALLVVVFCTELRFRDRLTPAEGFLRFKLCCEAAASGRCEDTTSRD